jgi:predicted amidohydrolase
VAASALAIIQTTKCFTASKFAKIVEFEEQIEYSIDVASDYKADFVTYPELFSTQLLSLKTEKRPPRESNKKITRYTDRYKASITKLAVFHNITIVGGSHNTIADDGELWNI